MNHLSRRALVALLVVASAGCATRGYVPGAEWQPQAERIAAAENGAGRAAAITARLDALGIPWQARGFQGADGQQGTNILADLGGEGPTLLLGAHYDRVDAGRGATDNASGCAVVLELAAALKAEPLAGHRVQLAFWDLEEKNLLGSRAYVRDTEAGPDLYVNFDVFAWGDTLWVMAPDGATAFIDSVRGATTAASLPVLIGTQYPPTDHLAFLRAERPAVSLSLLAGDEIAGVLEFYAQRKPPQVPKVMRVIHTPADLPENFDPAAVSRALPVVLDTLRRWARTAR